MWAGIRRSSTVRLGCQFAASWLGSQDTVPVLCVCVSVCVCVFISVCVIMCSMHEAYSSSLVPPIHLHSFFSKGVPSFSALFRLSPGICTRRMAQSCKALSTLSSQ